jgi:hypothetical protein
LWIALAALLVIGAVAAGFSAGGVAGFYAGTSGAPEVAPTVAPAPEDAPAAASGVPGAAASSVASGVTDVAAGHDVWLLLSSTPSGATVTTGGEALGTTPLARKVRVTEDIAAFAFALPGYADAALSLDVRGDNATGDVALKHLGGTAKKGASGSTAAPASTPSVVIADGVRFDSAVARKALTWVNMATKEQLLSAGIAPHQANILLETRPYADLGAVAETPFIGEKTVDAIRIAATK